jgi:hypothetical protein
VPHERHASAHLSDKGCFHLSLQTKVDHPSAEFQIFWMCQNYSPCCHNWHILARVYGGRKTESPWNPVTYADKAVGIFSDDKNLKSENWLPATGPKARLGGSAKTIAITYEK